MIWTLESGPWQAGPQQELTRVATGWKLTAKQSDASSLSFDIDARTDEAAVIRELVDDLWLWCDALPNPVTRGRITQSTDTFDDAGHKVSFSAVDYRGVLDRRICWDDWTLKRTSYDPALDGWQLIQQAQAEPGGNLGIARGTLPTDPVSIASITHQPGNSVKSEIDANAKLDPGFDWDISPVGELGLQANFWRAGRGRVTDAVLEYGPSGYPGRQVDSAAFGNAVRLPGGTDAANAQLPPVRKDAADIATRPEGRWDLAVQDNATFTTSAAGQARAAWELNHAVMQPSYTFAVRDGDWAGPQDYWVGDTVTLQIKSGRLLIEEPLPVVQMDLTGSVDRTNPTLSVTLGAYTFEQQQRLRLRSINRQLAALQRR